METWRITDTLELIGVVDKIRTPATYLVETMFPNAMPASTSSYVAVEYRSEGRRLAPYITRGARGVNVKRNDSRVDLYAAPLVAPRRVIGLNDIELRQFGEQPFYSKVTAAERAAQMQANDLVELLRTIQNRKNKFAADILQYGKTVIKGYADDGRTFLEDEFDLGWNGRKTVKVKWDQANAKIYDDLRTASEAIQESSGLIPTLMICGRNVEDYLLNNDEILKWLNIPNRDNLSMFNFQPHYTSAQARFVGQITALNLEVVSYAETYTDDDGEVKPFIEPDTVIIGVAGQGRQLYGAVTYMDDSKQWQTVSAENVPVYIADPINQQSSLTIYSRFVLIPNALEDWQCLKVK